MDHLDQCKPSSWIFNFAITRPQPLRYGFESILTNEFHTLKGACSVLVPSGSGYEDATLQNQVCTTVGSVPGQSIVDGNAYAQIAYGYSYSHLWRVIRPPPSALAYLIIL
jgi:ATP-binding cassette subfamily G (WHITE) protein 2 (SNQ2)